VEKKPEFSGIIVQNMLPGNRKRVNQRVSCYWVQSVGGGSDLFMALVLMACGPVLPGIMRAPQRGRNEHISLLCQAWVTLGLK
jgi:hypothetical protein